MSAVEDSVEVTCSLPKKAKIEVSVGGIGEGVAGKNAGNDGDLSSVSLPNGSAATEPFAFDKFNFKVLCTNPLSKSATLSGKFKNGTDEFGVIVAEKIPLTQSSLEELFANCEARKTFQNDIYAQYRLGSSSCGAGDVKVMTVYPATQKHLEKYGAQKQRIVVETPQLYEEVAKPYIESQAMSLDWVYNILEGKAEKDRVIHDDPHPETGFVLLPDIKWDGKELESLYLLAIAQTRGILSLRELRMEHVPMLRNILETGKREICHRYRIEGDQLRVYVHYHPSFYHLHVHFTHLNYHAPKSSLGDGHLLDDVIDNIQNIDPLYYAKKTLYFTMKESTALWKLYSQHSGASSL